MTIAPSRHSIDMPVVFCARLVVCCLQNVLVKSQPLSLRSRILVFGIDFRLKKLCQPLRQIREKRVIAKS